MLLIIIVGGIRTELRSATIRISLVLSLALPLGGRGRRGLLVAVVSVIIICRRVAALRVVIVVVIVVAQLTVDICERLLQLLMCRLVLLLHGCCRRIRR